MCRYLLSQTYTPKPDTTQRNSTECCIATGSHVHAGKALTISENIPNSDDICSQNTGKLNNRRVKNFLEAFSWKRRWIIFTSLKGHAVTLPILFLRGISWWWKVEKTFSSLNFWKHGAVNEFYGAIDISYQIRGAEFPVIRGMEKPKLLHSGTCTSTSTRHVTLKSPLLLQFPYCELCDNDNKQSNYRLMNVLCRTKAISADFSKSSK